MIFRIPVRTLYIVTPSVHTLHYTVLVVSSFNFMASPRTRGFPAIAISEAPECSICSERYDDSEEDLIPRNLACGHSMCSSKWLKIKKVH